MQHRLTLILITLCIAGFSALAPRPLYAQSCAGSDSIFGAVGYALNNSGTGYSMVALPFATTITDAAGFAAEIGGVSAMLKWNPTGQTFRFFAPPSSGDNFSLTTGDVVFVQLSSSGPTTFAVSGAVSEVQYTMPAGGYSFIALPVPCADLTNANGVGQAIAQTVALLAWNVNNQSFRFFAAGGGGDNFAVTAGMPFIVQLSAGSTVIWP